MAFLDSLDRRQELILYAVVHEHVLTAEPVGSHKLVDRYKLSVSSATVRSELALLEEEGYLIQPHTSAGRIPTDKGYRYYVDSLMRRQKLSSVEERSIHHFYSLLSKETEDLMRATSLLLSKLTSYISVVFAPSLARSTLRHLDLILLRPQAVLMVLITDTGQVVKRVLGLEEVINASCLSRVETLFNEKLNGVSLDQISSQEKQLFLESSSLEGRLLAKVIAQITSFLAEEERERIFLGGRTNILRQPEFEDVEEVKKLLSTLEEGYILLNLLESALQASQVVVKIGAENRQPSLDHCSLVASGYRLKGETVGGLGILGPTRMDYERAIPAVECIAENLSQALESIHSW